MSASGPYACLLMQFRAGGQTDGGPHLCVPGCEHAHFAREYVSSPKVCWCVALLGVLSAGSVAAPGAIWHKGVARCTFLRKCMPQKGKDLSERDKTRAEFHESHVVDHTRRPVVGRLRSLH